MKERILPGRARGAFGGHPCTGGQSKTQRRETISGDDAITGSRTRTVVRVTAQRGLQSSHHCPASSNAMSWPLLKCSPWDVARGQHRPQFKRPGPPYSLLGGGVACRRGRGSHGMSGKGVSRFFSRNNCYHFANRETEAQSSYISFPVTYGGVDRARNQPHSCLIAGLNSLGEAAL